MPTTVDAIAAAGGRALAVGVDVADEDRVAAAVDRVADELGPPTVLVNNAGITRDNLLFKMTEDDWDAVLARAPAGRVPDEPRGAGAHDKAGWGRIVNLSSTSALGNRGQANYAAAKAGMQGFTKTLAIELGKFGDHGQRGRARLHRHRDDAADRRAGRDGASRSSKRLGPPRRRSRASGRRRTSPTRSRSSSARARRSSPARCCTSPAGREAEPMTRVFSSLDELDGCRRASIWATATGCGSTRPGWTPSRTRPATTSGSTSTPTRAATGPFGSTIAHGYLTLSLLPVLVSSVVEYDGWPIKVNYGSDKVRFPQPVPVGSRVRAGLELTAVTEVRAGIQVAIRSVVEIESPAREVLPKPALVAETLTLLAD